MEYENSMKYTNEEEQIVFLKDADIVNDMSAQTISGNAVLSNGIPSYDLFRKYYNNVSTDISAISDDVEYLKTVDKKVLVYNETLLSADTSIDRSLTGFLYKNFTDPNYKFKLGWTYHLSASQTLIDADLVEKYIGENDYIIFNKDAILNNVKFTDIDLIRDAYTEVSHLSTSLSNSVNALCANLQEQITSNDADILTLSSDLSTVSSDISTKIWIKDPATDEFKDGKYSDLSVVKIPIDEYMSKASSKTLLSNVLYVISSDYIESYGQVISNMVMTDDLTLSEAASQHYVDALSTALSNDIDSLSTALSNDIVRLSVALSTDISVLNGNVDELSSKHLSLDNRYVNTFVDKDKVAKLGHISSDNLIVTDLNEHIVGDSTQHKQYYMSFESGTLVLKPLNF